jgi:hypothetical protein
MDLALLPPVFANANEFENSVPDGIPQTWSTINLTDMTAVNMSVSRMMRSRRQIMNLIYTMYEDSIVSAAANYRRSLIQMNKLVVVEGEGEMLGVGMSRYIDSFYQEIGWSIREYFDMFGMCPVRWVRKELYVGDDPDLRALHGDLLPDYIKIRVPVPLTKRTFDIETILGEDGFKEDIVTTYDGENIPTLLYCKDREGPRYNDPGFDSDCGAVLPEWIRLKTAEKINMEIQRSIMQPIIYLEKNGAALSSNAGDLNDAEGDRIRDIVWNKYGYPRPGQPHIRPIPGGMIIPNDFRMCTTQPIKTMVLNEKEIHDNLVSKVAAIWNISYALFTLQSEGIGKLETSSYSIDMERRRTASMMQVVISHVSDAIQTLLAMEFGFIARVHIPMQPQVDMRTLQEMRAAGILSDDFVRTESLNIIGVHHHRIRELSRSDVQKPTRHGRRHKVLMDMARIRRPGEPINQGIFQPVGDGDNLSSGEEDLSQDSDDEDRKKKKKKKSRDSDDEEEEEDSGRSKKKKKKRYDSSDEDDDDEERRRKKKKKRSRRESSDDESGKKNKKLKADDPPVRTEKNKKKSRDLTFTEVS